MMPVARGAETTRIQILGYSLLVVLASFIPAFTGGQSFKILYASLAMILGVGLLYHAGRLWYRRSEACAQAMFRYSIFYLFALFLALMPEI